MKLKGIKTIEVKDISEACDRTQELYDIYINSDEVKDLTVDSELVGGVLTMARVSTLGAMDLMKRLKKSEIEKGFLLGTTVALASYYVYNEIIKDSKTYNKLKNKFSK